jgi:hypothetical protein
VQGNPLWLRAFNARRVLRCRTFGDCLFSLLDGIEVGKDDDTLANERIERERASRRTSPANVSGTAEVAAKGMTGVDQTAQ